MIKDRLVSFVPRGKNFLSQAEMEIAEGNPTYHQAVYKNAAHWYLHTEMGKTNQPEQKPITPTMASILPDIIYLRNTGIPNPTIAATLRISMTRLKAAVQVLVANGEIESRASKPLTKQKK